MSTDTTGSAAVRAQNVTFHFGEIRALDDLSLDVPRGVSFGLLGPNGAGKTTLIRIIVGLLTPRAGTVRVLGQPVTRQTSLHIGYMPQQYSLYTELSVAQNIDFFARLYGMRDRETRRRRVDEVVKLVDLRERRNDAIHRLSGGMKQRVSLACAIVHDPPVLFLDEPTVGLDPELRVNFWDHFAGLNKKGVTIIISSHTMDDAAHCDRLAFIRSGRVMAEGTPGNLREAVGKPGASLEDAFLYFVRRGEKPNA